MRDIVIRPIGRFKQNAQYPDIYETPKAVFVPLFGSKMHFSFECIDEDFLKKAQIMIDGLFSLTLHHRDKISKYVWQNCQEFLQMVDYDEVDEPLHEIINNQALHQIWHHIQPTHINIMQDDDTQVMFLLVYCNCDWEQEHGLQLTIKQTTIKQAATQQATTKQGMILTAVTPVTCYYEDNGLKVDLLSVQ